MVSVFVVLIFIPATEHASENLSRACWRPFWVESSIFVSIVNSVANWYTRFEKSGIFFGYVVGKVLVW